MEDIRDKVNAMIANLDPEEREELELELALEYDHPLEYEEGASLCIM